MGTAVRPSLDPPVSLLGLGLLASKFKNFAVIRARSFKGFRGPLIWCKHLQGVRERERRARSAVRHRRNFVGFDDQVSFMSFFQITAD